MVVILCLGRVICFIFSKFLQCVLVVCGCFLVLLKSVRLRLVVSGLSGCFCVVWVVEVVLVVFVICDCFGLCWVVLVLLGFVRLD